MPIIPNGQPDTIISEDSIHVKEQLAQAIRKLPDIEIVVIILWVLIGLTQQEIGDIIGLSRASVWSVKESAFRTLRDDLDEEDLSA